jgi:hypothetical protein
MALAPGAIAFIGRPKAWFGAAFAAYTRTVLSSRRAILILYGESL